jgi:hypothetical protein
VLSFRRSWMHDVRTTNWLTQVRIKKHWRADELTQEIIRTPGCSDAAQGDCLVSRGVFDLKWESQLQVTASWQ